MSPASPAFKNTHNNNNKTAKRNTLVYNFCHNKFILCIHKQIMWGGRDAIKGITTQLKSCKISKSYKLGTRKDKGVFRISKITELHKGYSSITSISKFIEVWNSTTFLTPSSSVHNKGSCPHLAVSLFLCKFKCVGGKHVSPQHQTVAAAPLRHTAATPHTTTISQDLSLNKAIHLYFHSFITVVNHVI